MSTIYTTKEGDRLDWICWKHYGADKVSGAVEAVLDANSRLADQGEVFPAGVKITLPEIDTTGLAEGVSLWT